MKAPEYTSHQFNMFSYEQTRPKAKVPLSRKKIQEVKRLIELKDGLGAAKLLREIREGLENFERKLK